MLYGEDHSGNEKTVQCEILVPDSWVKTKVGKTDRFCVESSSVLVQRELESVLIVAIQGLKNCQLK